MFHDSPITAAVRVQRRQKKSFTSIRENYKLDEVANFIRNGNNNSNSCNIEKELLKEEKEKIIQNISPFRRVALQFPDELLDDAIAVMEMLKQILNEEHVNIDNLHINNNKNKPENSDKIIIKEENEDKEEIKLFVIADNTFGSCCPDEITAQHYNSDCIIHFGDACMSRTTRIPVFYVQDNFKFSLPFTGELENNNNNNKNEQLSVKVILHTIELLQNRLKELYKLLIINPNIEINNINLVIVGCHRSQSLVEAAKQEWKMIQQSTREEIEKNKVLIEWCNFESNSMIKQKFDSSTSSSIMNNDNSWVINSVRFSRTNSKILQYFLFIGPSNTSIPLHLLNIHYYNLFHYSEELRDAAFDNSENNSPSVLSILDETLGHDIDITFLNENEENIIMHKLIESQFTRNITTIYNLQIMLNKRMRQRAFNIELIRSTSAIGIIVTSLAIEGYYETTMLLHQLLRAYGKRSYIIYIGHLNQYKIANFVDTVDCFVSIACPNSREANFPSKDDAFSKPVVSPIEVLLALQTNNNNNNNNNNDENENNDDDENNNNSDLFGHPAVYSTTFDTILPPLREAMQKVEAIKKEKQILSLENINNNNNDGSGAALIRRAPPGVLINHNNNNGALMRLHERSFIGLEPKMGETPVQEKIIEGKHGIARGYTSEREK